MNRYNIRIDGQVMPNPYTYKELLLNDILDFDDIEVKQVSKSNWTNIKSFYFPEEHEKDIKGAAAFIVDESGHAHFNAISKSKEKSQNDYVIDEFGQIVSRNNIGGSTSSSTNSSSSSSNTTASRSSSSSYSSSSSSSSSDVDGWIILKIIITILIIGFIIALITTDGWGAISIPPVVWILNKMWNNN